jgi:citrate synthase
MDSGLAGLVAAETVLSHSDGARGILWVRGHTLPDLAANFGYDGAVGLLWEGFAGEGLTRDIMRARLGAGRERVFARLDDWLGQGSAAADRGRAVGLAALPEDTRRPTSSPPAGRDRGIAAPATRRRAAHAGPGAQHRRRSLRMAQGNGRAGHGRRSTPGFTAVIDNGLNTSAFTACHRLERASRCRPRSALCAFTGPLHGGAPGPTLDMLDEAAASGDVAAWAERKLAGGAG